MNLLHVLIGLVVVGDVLCADKTATAGGTTIKVLGQSGKIKMYNATEGNEDNAITITMDGIFEKTAEGDQIAGQSKHSFQNFAQLDFTFTDPADGTYMDSGLNVVHFSFMSDITVGSVTAKLITYIYVFKESGNITVDGDNVTINEGDMKFNIEIKDWPFCGYDSVICVKGNNKEYVGAFLDFDIKITGTKEPNASATGDVGGARVITPKEVLYDNTTAKDMPSGYPKSSTSGRDTVYTFRFEQFNTSVLYDPIVSKLDDSSDDNGGTVVVEETATFGGVTAKLKGASGKIELMSEASKVVVELDNLKEVTTDGSAINDNMHSYNSFAGKSFTLMPTQDATYADIAVKKISAETTMPNAAMVKLHLYIMKAAGNITNGNEQIMVKRGDVKFNVEISNWAFCDNSCTGGVGEYLDIQIVIKGKKSKAVKKQSANNTGQMFDLGGESAVILSNMIYVDDETDPVVMMTGYPMLVTKGSKEVFSFRFPKFVTKVLYDPTVRLNNSTSGSTKASATLSVMLIAMVLPLLQRLL